MSRGKLLLLLLLIAAIAFAISMWSGRNANSPPTSQLATQPTTGPATTTATAPAKFVDDWISLIHHRLPRYTTTQPLDNRLKLSESLHLVLDKPVYLDAAGELWITDPAAPPLAEVLAKAATQPMHIVRQPVLFVHWWTDNGGKRIATPIMPTSDGLFAWMDTAGKPHPLPPGAYDWSSALSMNQWIVVPGPATASAIRWQAGRLLVQSIDFTQVNPPATAPAGPSTATTATPDASTALVSSAAATTPASPTAAANSSAAQEAMHDPAAASIRSAGQTGHDLPHAILIADTRGVIACLPAQSSPPAPHDPRVRFFAARFADEHWQPLAVDQWPASMLHLIPMVDGNVLQVRAAQSPGKITLHWVPLDAPQPTSQEVDQWLTDLGSTDPAVLTPAQQNLLNNGRAILPMLQQKLSSLPEPNRQRLKWLIDQGLTPSLAGMRVISDRLRVVDRQPNGSVLFYAESGVVLPALDGSSTGQTLSPAWLLAQPGFPIRPVPMRLISDRLPDSGHLQLIDNDWIAIDATGPKLFIGNDLVYITTPEERSFSRLLGIDREKRWILQQSPDSLRSPKTLIIDPHMPDNRPHMPIWKVVSFQANAMGWDRKGYPAIQRGKSVWVLDQASWRALDSAKDGALITAAPPATQPDLPADLNSSISNPINSGSPATAATADRSAGNSAPSTGASLAPGTSDQSEIPVDPSIPTASSEDAPPLLTERNYLLTDHSGRKYFGGRDQLTIQLAPNRLITTLLPPEAVGRLEPKLVEDAAGALYLFNESGRIVRLRLDLDSPNLLTVEATFTRRVPQGPIRHAWLDPCKRLCFIDQEQGSLYVCFPEGHIPRALSNLIPDELLDDPY